MTGGGRGIGRSIALALARAGADVAVSARSVDEIESVAGEIEALGRKAAAVTFDVMDRSRAKPAVDEAAEKLGGLEILVNNAGGVITDDPRKLDHLRHDPQTFEDNLFLNLTQAFYCANAALPYMMEARWGRIVSIGSGYATNGGGGLAYSAAKHGLIGMTRSLAYPAAKYGINVNVLDPGWTNTRLVNWAGMGRARGISADEAKAWAAAQAIQDRIVEPDELGPIAALLCSDAGSAITGQVVRADGGFMV